MSGASEDERLRALIAEVFTADPASLTSVLAETGWFKRARAALTAPSAGTGEGWQLVPVMQTDEMRDAAMRAYQDDFEKKYPDHFDKIWAAQLAAAPSPSRREPTREEIAKALYRSRTDISVAITELDFAEYNRSPVGLDYLRMNVFAAYRDADAVLALLDRAGNNK